jgi:hypothetical protein
MMDRLAKSVWRRAQVPWGRRTPTATVIAAIAVALVAVGCGRGDEPGPSRPIGAGPTSTSSGAAARAPAPGPLPPGTYQAAHFRPKLSFRVGEGWALLGDEENILELAAGFDPTSNPDQVITFLAIKWVIDRPLLTDRERLRDRERHIRPAPRDLVGWLRANPYLKMSTSKPVRLGGVPGVRFDVTVKRISDPSNCEEIAPRHCVFLFPITRTGDDYTETEGGLSRYTLVEVEGQPVLVSVSAPTNRFEDFAAEADKVLRTVSFA